MKKLLCLISLSFTAFVLAGCSSPQVQALSNVKVTPEIRPQHAVMSDGYKLPYLTNQAEDKASAVFVAVHGFNDYSNAFKGFCEYMAGQGKHCYAYDQRGFGKTEFTGIWPSEGKLQSDLQTWINLLKQQYPDLPLYVVGESMGGAVVMTTMNQYPLANVEGFVLFAPAVWARKTQPWYQRLGLWAALHTVPGWKPTGNGIKRVASNNREALLANGRDPLFIKGTRIDTIYGLTNLMDKALAVSKNKEMAQRNTLLLYGANDQIIPKKPLCLAVNNIDVRNNKWQMNHYAGGYHMLTRDLEAKDNFADVVEWLNNKPATNDAMLEYCKAK